MATTIHRHLPRLTSHLGHRLTSHLVHRTLPRRLSKLIQLLSFQPPCLQLIHPSRFPRFFQHLNETAVACQFEITYKKFIFFLISPLIQTFIIFRSNATHSRVVGGLPAQTNAWPWIALVGYRNAFESTPKFMCGGTLITQVWFGWVFGWFLVL